MNSWTHASRSKDGDKRACERQKVALAARLTWKDQRGATRFATGVIRDLSEHSVFVECHSAVPINLFRLVQLQLERDARGTEAAPAVLRQGRVLTAVYRVVPPTPAGQPQGFALRMMIDPKRRPIEASPTRATA